MLMLVAGPAQSADEICKGPIPRGIYALFHVDQRRGAPPGDDAAAKSFVTGIAVRTYWNLIEPREGEFDWRVFDATVALAKKHGKVAGLRVMNGTGTPEWVYSAGAKRYDAGQWQGKIKGSVPVAWDPVFNDKWRRFLDALGERYDADPTVAYIAMSMPAGAWAELFHPRALRELPDYSYEKWRSIQEEIIGHYARAFRRTPLTLALSGHGPLRQFADDITDHLIARYGRDARQIFIQANGWSDHGVMGAPSPEIEASFSKIWEKPLRRGFQQVAAVAWTKRGDTRMGDQKKANALFFQLRGEYAEIYDADILSDEYRAPLEQLADALRR